jgi:hypothetical protein
MIKKLFWVIFLFIILVYNVESQEDIESESQENVKSQEFVFGWTIGDIGFKTNGPYGSVFSNILPAFIFSKTTSLGLYFSGVHFEANNGNTNNGKAINGISSVLPIELAYIFSIKPIIEMFQFALYVGVQWGFYGLPLDFSVRNEFNYYFGIRLTTFHGLNEPFLFFPFLWKYDFLFLEYNPYKGITVGMGMDPITPLLGLLTLLISSGQ